MVRSPEDAEAAVARLEARVAALEEELERRSRVLRAITREVCERDRIVMTRVAAGRAPHPGADYSLLGFRETTELEPAEVSATLEELWEALRFPVVTPSE